MSKRPSVQKARPPAGGGEDERYQSLDFSRKNWILFGSGIAAIAAGFALLAAGDISLAPILLVAGYLALIPWALVTHAKRQGGQGTGTGTGE